MKITHHFLNRSVTFDSDFIGLLNCDNIGGYFLLTYNNQTRYQGWHINIDGTMFKIIDSFKVLSQGSLIGFENRIWKIRKSYEGFFEEVILPYGFIGMFYKLSKPLNFEINFDIKKGYENPTEGRLYKINLLDKKTFHLVFQQTNSQKEKIFEINVIGKINAGKIEKKENWTRIEYNYDKFRVSNPFEKWVFSGISILGAKELVLSAGRNFEEAQKNFNKIYKNKKVIFERTRKINQRQVIFHKNIPENISWALTLCKSALKNLSVLSKDRKTLIGLYAGLPWFYQFWLRDEAMALKALTFLDKKLAKELSLIRLQSFLRMNSLNFEGTQSLDGLLLYLKKIFDIYVENPSFFNVRESKLFLSVFIHISKLLKESEINGLLFCDGKKTWMDSIKRSDFALEIQFLYAAFLSNLFKLTKNTTILNSLNKLIRVIRNKYYENGILKDGVDDLTIRPNVFLAYYYYSRVFRKSEWEKIFDITLEKIYLEWGGISTIDKNSPHFTSFYTGENPRSYHQGDSWFYLNNIAAWCLLDVNFQKYSNKIKSIIQSSSEDILKKLIPGYSSELSSAGAFAPAGSFCQLWSSATFIELIKKIYPQI